MPNYKVLSDSSCDLTKELLEKYDIEKVPFGITFNGLDYYKEAVELENSELYRRMREEKAYPKTSLPSTQDYIDKFTPHVEQGKDVICVCITSKFSGSYQSAVTAGEILKEDFPDRKFYILDSESVTVFQGALVIEIAKMRDAGFEIEKAYEIAEKIKKDAKAYITVDTLEYLEKGGRIGKVSALAGNLFNIKPVISLYDGELQPVSKVMGKKKALKEIAEMMNKEIGDKKEDYNIVLGNADCINDAEELNRLLESKGFTLNLPIMDVGSTITVHGGPGIMGVGYIKKYDRYK